MPELDTLSWNADWVARNTGVTVTPELARCIDTLSAIQRPYNWVLINDGWRGAVTWPHTYDDRGEYDEPPLLPPVLLAEKWMTVRLRMTFATYDMSELTRLVIAAHKHLVRVEVSSEVYRWIDTESYVTKSVDGKWVETDEHPTGAGACLRVQMNARQSDGRLWERHPTLQDLAGMT